MKPLLIDMAASLLFLAVVAITGDVYLATGVGLVTGIGLIVWRKLNRQPIDLMQVMVLGLVVGLGGATLVTRNPHFVMWKPVIIHSCIGAMMLRPGWTIRYMPAFAVDLIPRGLMLMWGYLWSAAMFAVAGSSLAVAYMAGPRTWALYTAVAPWAVIAILTLAALVIFPPIVRRNAKARGVLLPSQQRKLAT